MKNASTMIFTTTMPALKRADSRTPQTRITVIAAGFDRYDGERPDLRRTSTSPSLGLRDPDADSTAADSAFGREELDDDDEFEVPEFLR